MKLSVSVDAPLVAFMAAYQLKAGLKSRSAVVEDALKLLAEREAEADLALAYAASAAGARARLRRAGLAWIMASTSSAI